MALCGARAQTHFRALCHWAGELTTDGPTSRRAAKSTSRRVHERQEIEPASSTPTPRTGRNAPSEMARPYAAVFRLSAPLVAHSCTRLAIRSGQSHPVSWTQAQPSDWDRIATALSGSGHSAAKEEHAPSMTLPPTSLHAIVWCVGRHTCSPVPSHPATDASDKSASRTWGPCRPASPKTPSEASYEARNEPEECLSSTMAGRSRALFVTKRTSPDKERFFRNKMFCGTFVLQKNWNSHQPRLGITPLAQFRGPIARFGANSLPGPLPLGR